MTTMVVGVAAAAVEEEEEDAPWRGLVARVEGWVEGAPRDVDHPPRVGDAVVGDAVVPRPLWIANHPRPLRRQALHLHQEDLTTKTATIVGPELFISEYGRADVSMQTGATLHPVHLPHDGSPQLYRRPRVPPLRVKHHLRTQVPQRRYVGVMSRPQNSQ